MSRLPMDVGNHTAKHMSNQGNHSLIGAIKQQSQILGCGTVQLLHQQTVGGHGWSCSVEQVYTRDSLQGGQGWSGAGIHWGQLAGVGRAGVEYARVGRARVELGTVGRAGGQLGGCRVRFFHFQVDKGSLPASLASSSH